MKIIYIAGPFRGANTWEIECNIRRAEEWGLKVATLGAMPLIPHTNTRFFHGLLNDQFWLDGTRELLKRCDGAFFTPNWIVSSGSRGEMEVARRMMPVFENLEDLELWLAAPEDGK